MFAHQFERVHLVLRFEYNRFINEHGPVLLEQDLPLHHLVTGSRERTQYTVHGLLERLAGFLVNDGDFYAFDLLHKKCTSNYVSVYCGASHSLLQFFKGSVRYDFRNR